MNENQSKEQIKVRSSVLEENQRFKEAIAAKNEQLREKDEIIKSLPDDLGNSELTITSLTREKDLEKSLRIKAEKVIDNEKKLERSGHEMFAPPKSREEKFAEEYKEACQKLRNQN